MRIQNANAMSSPYTIGFPAMTAWLGAVHALQRFVIQNGFVKIFFTKMAVACHDFKLHAYQNNSYDDKLIIGTANPLKKKGSNFERPPFIPEARCNLEVSLLVEVTGVDGDNKNEFIDFVQPQLHRMKMAGGDILSFHPIEVLFVDGNDLGQVRACLRKLMPGYVLVERRDLMETAMENGNDALGALLDSTKVSYVGNADDTGNVKWRAEKSSGWIVPIAVGFHGISELGNVVNQRDEKPEHRFAESVVTLGEFKMPYRFQSLDEMMWYYSTDLAQDLYVCKNQQ
jgi:CRISPR-associated protein Csy2